MNRSALVLGGGFAGLSASIHLALAGFEVRLLEQTPTLGGKAGQLERDGFRFDTGPSVFTLARVVEDMFKAAGRPLPFEIKPLDRLCRYLFPSGRVWDVYQNVEKTTAQLSSADAQVYRDLLEEARKLYEAAAPTFVYGEPPTPGQLARYGFRHGLGAHPFKTLPGLLEHFGARDDLKTFFLRFATYFGADPYRAPAILHNIAWVELGLGVGYPVGGIYAVVEGLAALARELGVEVCLGTKVEGLEHNSNRIQKVHTSQGVFEADAVVSALDIVRTHQLLGLKTGLERAEPSLSGFVLLMGIEGASNGLGHHTISFPQDYRAEFRDIARGRFPAVPTLYLNISCKTDSSDAPPGCENWFVMANAPAVPDLDEAAYEAAVLEGLEQRDLLNRDRILFTHRLGPSYLSKLAYRGSIYGAAPHSLLGTLRPAQHIKGIRNLALAGGTVYPGGGVPLALLSGKAAARRLARSLPESRQAARPSRSPTRR